LEYLPVYDVSLEFPRATDDMERYVTNEFGEDIPDDEREDVYCIIDELFEEKGQDAKRSARTEYVFHDRIALVEVEGDKLIVSTFRHRG
jgi:hypothetical protein